MKKLKLFQKNYLITMFLMGIMILISHVLLYVLLPKFYTNKKQKDLEQISASLSKELEGNDEEVNKKIARDFSVKYKVGIILTMSGKSYMFEGNTQKHVYIDPEQMNTENIKDENIEVLIDDNAVVVEEVHENGVKEIDTYFKIRHSSLVRLQEFKLRNKEVGKVKIIMDLQSVKEARGVVFMVLPYSISISLIISLVAAYIYTKFITDPIKEICETTKEMKMLQKDSYCNITTGDEIELLADNINSLYETLWKTISSLKKEVDNISKSEQTKIDFLRGASHELKTPLMSIHIMLENMILDVGKYKDHKTYLAKCKDIVIELSNMVQEILDTSKLSIKHNPKDETIINLKDVIESVIKPYKIIARSKHVNLEIDYFHSFSIRMNEELLKKVLSNVISNAVNYTNEGYNINIYFKGDSVIIENECIPIPKEQLEHIFDAFYRVDFDRNKNSGGNGLGLHIVKQILMTVDIPYSFEATKTGMKFTINFKSIMITS